ncbi:hypothetical protein BJY14_004717 [Actinomadura luteofluorescens]|uniref:Uncharacterized protein n=1 Tax=Actinomadura luteofluorescens TaxID=46163 RepID=A0A7Y9EJC8_9ACTN|nr:hypothetical protein [Actinomadura luteofluorescens]
MLTHVVAAVIVIPVAARRPSAMKADGPFAETKELWIIQCENLD